MKKVKHFLLAVPLFTIISVIALSGCFFTDDKTSALSYINESWNINIPSSVELVHKSKNRTLTDGTYYYVFETSDEQNSVTYDDKMIEYSAVNDDIIEKYERIVSDVSSTDFDDNYAVNWEHNLVCYYQTNDPRESGEFIDYIILIYDDDLSYLYAMIFLW